MSSEIQLVSLIYGLYFWECLQWLKHNEIAFISNRKAWVRRQRTTTSFILLDRMPLLRNPLSFSPGLFICDSECPDCSRETVPALYARLRLLRIRTRYLRINCAISGTYLLLTVPAILLSHLLPMVWKPLVVCLLVLHFFVVGEFFIAASYWRHKDRESFFQALLSICINPIGALRSSDLIAKWMGTETCASGLEIVLINSKRVAHT